MSLPASEAAISCSTALREGSPPNAPQPQLPVATAMLRPQGVESELQKPQKALFNSRRILVGAYCVFLLVTTMASMATTCTSLRPQPSLIVRSSWCPDHSKVEAYPRYVLYCSAPVISRHSFSSSSSVSNMDTISSGHIRKRISS